jgi:hypothetical protein
MDWTWQACLSNSLVIGLTYNLNSAKNCLQQCEDPNAGENEGDCGDGSDAPENLNNIAPSYN